MTRFPDPSGTLDAAKRWRWRQDGTRVTTASRRSGEADTVFGEWPTGVDERITEEPDELGAVGLRPLLERCGMDIGVKDGRIVGVRGARSTGSTTAGSGRRGCTGGRRTTIPTGSTQPLIREGAAMREASWDEAMDLDCEDRPARSRSSTRPTRSRSTARASSSSRSTIRSRSSSRPGSARARPTATPGSARPRPRHRCGRRSGPTASRLVRGLRHDRLYLPASATTWPAPRPSSGRGSWTGWTGRSRRSSSSWTLGRPTRRRRPTYTCAAYRHGPRRAQRHPAPAHRARLDRP